MKHIMAMLFAATAISLPARASTLFSLLPMGNISGHPGDTVGWGFTISNNINFLLVTGANFCLDNSTDCFNPSPNFTDFISSNRVVVGPSPESPMVSQVFNLGSQRGVGSYTIPVNDPIGDVASGLIVLTYSLYSRSPNDPNFNPETDSISFDNFLSQPASVQTTPTLTPEPASLGLTALALGVLGTMRLMRGSISSRRH